MATTAYENNGVLTGEGSITGTYNALNQPITVTAAATGTLTSFGYDPLGRCIKRSSGALPTQTSYLYYDNWNLIQEGANALLADRTYVHGNRIDEIVASQAGSQTYYHHFDARGHCITLTNSSGAIAEQYDYDAFGKPYFYSAAGVLLPNGSAIGNRFLFTGREWLSDLKLYDYRNRLYQPELGRFVQPDPKQFEAGDYNLYRYCHNDPVNNSDPLGLIVYKFSPDYPAVGPTFPGGKEIAQEAIKDMSNTKRGKELMKMDKDRVITIKPTDAKHPRTAGIDKRAELYLNPSDRSLLDPKSKETLANIYPTERYPDNAKGRAALMGHETGHLAAHENDEGLGGRNVRHNENPIRFELGVDLRPFYSGVPVNR